MQSFVCIIPARYASSRFPGKPVMPIHGVPMINWITKHSSDSKLLEDIIVATDDERILRVVEDDPTRARAVMTPDLPNGSERVAYVAKDIQHEWIFEMQGDQPMVTAAVLEDFLQRAYAEVEKNPAIDVVIPFAPATDAHTQSPDVLKVVVTTNGRLVFQTRQPIKTGWRTLGLYLWKNDALQKFANLPVADIEKAEDSHPIRLYANDFYVQGIPIDTSDWVEVDRDHQIAEVEKLMKEKGLL